jgi:hypothetical protein
MASNSKNIAELLNGDTTLTATDIANDAVTADKIATGAVVADGLGAGSVTATALGASAVTTAKINAGAVTTAKITGNLGRRNLIINGDFQVNQRRNGSGVSDAGYIGVDRWRGYISANSTIYLTQTAFAHGQSDVDKDLRHYLKFDWLGTGSATTKILSQRIENVQKGNGQKVTVSFWGRTEQADDCTIQLHQHFGTSGSGGVDHVSGTIDLTTSWQYFTHTFDLTSTSGKTVGANNSLRLEFVFGPATLNSYFEVTGVQVEVGDTATAYEHRSYSEELAACQRYCQRISQSGGDYYVMTSKGQSSNAVRFAQQLAFPLRVSPTISQGGGISTWRVFRPTAGVVTSSNTPTVIGFVENAGFVILQLDGLSGITDNYLYGTSPSFGSAGYFNMDSEL